MDNQQSLNGGKGASLKVLSDANFPVPPFHIIESPIYREAESLHFTKIPDSFEKTFLQILDRFKNVSVAVRSSATKEDGTQYSFAGIFDTYLDLKSENDIRDAVIKCWKSLITPRSLQYCKQNGIDETTLEMAVVIQEFIEPDFAGVLFTVNPITGNDDEIMIEACHGTGEKLVSGLISPSSFILNGHAINSHTNLGSSNTFTKDSYSHINEKNLIKNSSDKMDIQPSIQILSNLKSIALAIQAHYGTPQDIEFGVKDQRIYIFQSRPITKIQYSKNLGNWTTSDFRDGGVSSSVVSPVMWGLYERVFTTSLPNYFMKLNLITETEARDTQWYKVFYGRPYWNLDAVKNIQETLPGYNERNFDQDMAIPINYDGDGITTGMSLKAILKALKVLKALRAEYTEQKNRSQELVKHFPEIEQYYLNLNLASLSEDEFKKSLEKIILEVHCGLETQYFNTIYNASNAKLEFSDEFKFYKKINNTLDFTNLISGLGEMKVTAPAYFLQKIAQDMLHENPAGTHETLKKLNLNKNILLEDLKTYPTLYNHMKKFQEKFYHHSERELDLLVPRWGENLRFALDILLSLTKSPVSSLVKSQEEGINTYENEFSKLKKTHHKSWKAFIPGKWSTVKKKLERVRQFLFLREEVRDCSTKVYFFIRLHLLEMGKRTGLGDDIFYLSIDNVIRYSQKNISLEVLKRNAQEMKIYTNGYRYFKNSNEIGFRFNSSQWKAKPKAKNGKISYSGIGSSSGVYTGRARVIKNISEAAKLQSGEIMVVPFTDPGWTPLFSLAAAVVTEFGGILSHAALISREYGIPCVLNINGITDLIKDGAIIEVDGSEGSVTVL